MQIRTVATDTDLAENQGLSREYFAWVRDEHGIDLGCQDAAAKR